MNSSWIDILHLFLQNRIPLITTVLLVMLFFVPVDSVQVDYFRPAVSLICVYFWVKRQPEIFSYLSAFTIGFIIDIYSSTPLGLNSLLLMTMTATLRLGRKYMQVQPFYGEWLIFSLLCFAIFLLKWILLSVLYGKIFSFFSIVFNFLSTVTFYPLIAYINILISNKFLSSEKENELR